MMRIVCALFSLCQAQVTVPSNLLIIGGFPKCGTSYLYAVIASHPQVLACKKEVEPRTGLQIHYEDAVFFYAQNIQKVDYTDVDLKVVKLACHRSFQGRNETITECNRLLAPSKRKLQNPKVLLLAHIQFLGNKFLLQRWGPSVRIIFLVRDPADYWWAAYNFWRIPGLDPEPFYRGQWTDPAKDFRSPELFHQMLLADGRIAGYRVGEMSMTGGRWFFQVSDVQRKCAKHLVLRSEDFLDAEHSGNAVDKVGQFAGLDVAGFSSKVLSSKANTQFHVTNRGIPQLASREQGQEGIYEVSGFRPMLCESRLLIYQKWQPLCVNLTLQYNINYSGCLMANDTVCEAAEHRIGILNQTTIKFEGPAGNFVRQLGPVCLDKQVMFGNFMLGAAFILYRCRRQA